MLLLSDSGCRGRVRDFDVNVLGDDTLFQTTAIKIYTCAAFQYLDA